MVIHETAVVSLKAKIGESVSIGAYSIIYDNVVIGGGSTIGAHCELGVESSLGDGSPLVIGKYGNVRSGSVFYESSSFGDHLATGHKVVVRERTLAGDGLQIGTLSDVQGHCQFGQYVRMHSNVHVGQRAIIRDYVWLFPYVIIVNDPHPPSDLGYHCEIDSFAVIGARAILMPVVKIGCDSLVAASSVVSADVDNGMLVAGNPAKPISKASRIPTRDGTKRPAYPWRYRFHRGYPNVDVQGGSPNLNARMPIQKASANDQE